MELAVGQSDGIMHIVGGRSPRERVVVDIGEVEAVEHLGVDKLRGSPRGIAVVD